jgi:membrane protease subunit HflC
MNNRIKQILIVATIAVILFASSIFTIDQRQQALILQFGDPIRVIKTPGIKFKVPFLQNVVIFDKRIIDLVISEQEVIASDQKRLIINAFAKYQITDPLKFYTSVATQQGLSSKLSGIIDSSLRQVIGETTLNELLTENRTNIMQDINDAVSISSEIFGIKIAEFSMTARITVIYLEMVQQASNI